MNKVNPSTNMSNPTRIIITIVLILSFIILNIDYFITDEFEIEGIFWFGFNVPLVICILRLLKVIKINKLIAIALNLTLGAIGLFCMYILSLLSFGYGFSGGDLPSILTISYILDIALLISVGTDILTLIVKSDKEVNSEKR